MKNEKSFHVRVSPGVHTKLNRLLKAEKVKVGKDVKLSSRAAFESFINRIYESENNS